MHCLFVCFVLFVYYFLQLINIFLKNYGFLFFLISQKYSEKEKQREKKQIHSEAERQSDKETKIQRDRERHSDKIWKDKKIARQKTQKQTKKV